MAKEKNLKQKAAAGMVWTALQKYSTMFIAFISGIILARLLTPYDYGCIYVLCIHLWLDYLKNSGAKYGDLWMPDDKLSEIIEEIKMYM